MGRKNKKRKKNKKLNFNFKCEFLTTKISCPECKHEILYYSKYDCEVCLFCDTWLHDKCGDSNCKFCANRPKSPKDALALEELKIILRTDDRWRNYKIKKIFYDPSREKRLDTKKPYSNFPDKNEFRARRILEQLKNK